MAYRSKQDWWVALVLLLVSLLDLGIGSLLLYAAILQGEPWSVLLAGLVAALIGGVVLWVYIATDYDIRPPELTIRSGPFRFTIPLDALAEVRRKKGFAWEWGWHFALSQDRLFLRYRKTNGRLALLGVTISPDDQDGFLNELLRGLPGVQVIDS